MTLNNPSTDSDFKKESSFWTEVGDDSLWKFDRRQYLNYKELHKLDFNVLFLNENTFYLWRYFSKNCCWLQI